MISTANQTPILAAEILQYTRSDKPIVKPERDTTHKDQGRITVRWNILEYRDSIRLQLIIAGKPDVRVSATAVIEDQGEIRKVPFVPPFSRIQLLIGILFVLAMAVVMLFLVVTGKSRALRRKAAWESYLDPLPDDLLKAVSPLVDPRWWIRAGWYIAQFVFMVIAFGVSLLILWVFFIQVPPAPPLP
jgi:hypothetical protein